MKSVRQGQRKKCRIPDAAYSSGACFCSFLAST
ncbi:hypothetical protein SAMN05421830_11920 [Desulfomicrobium norvegicum]|uniref:Uncharacterized protein n=1 Tax=Desulfomicrobium norvegicum (strain DSM 1741 / NCIMB 8310) TaxID=52561 RepID=A0A8G2C611_DESNO|nr:hypothetical protein SAMN05421830_11920 [Desulfomicrobium norvegicum]